MGASSSCIPYTQRGRAVGPVLLGLVDPLSLVFWKSLEIQLQTATTQTLRKRLLLSRPLTPACLILARYVRLREVWVCAAMLVVSNLFWTLAVMLMPVVILAVEESTDGVFGQAQLSRQGVDGLLVWVEAHILNEALQDSQCFVGDP
ncbi:hypothetical protein EYF80_017631 [Liparis tanakae]|uniref:Uncharacterized protein n=1 Tax=Liparis tanakae TaxID=230148 RepID=A0A4Z2I4P2_9TELE|nr:hypothetical protein EYF80_017631 [Liparis tanakae]